MPSISIHELNALPAPRFRDILAGIFEQSPWVAAAVEPQRPFGDSRQLLHAMAEAVAAATPDARLALLRAHPELAGREARQGALTANSTQEQRSAGLDRLSPAEMERVARGNDAYRRRFGFPFIICVRNHDKAGILDALERRLRNAPDDEFEAALREVNEIARLRLEALLSSSGP